MNPFISVIVPVYNVAGYLPTCLNSLLRQGISDDEYEVILINDGSTDESENICLQYASKYENFTLLNQKNQGVGMARNNGMKVARGRYVMFVDSDDYLADCGLRQIVDVVKANPDYDLVRFFSSYSSHPQESNVNTVDYKGTAECLLKRGGFPAFIWTFAYRKSFLDKYNIRFEKLRFSEDGLFIATVLLHNPMVVSTKASIYRYVLREGSAIGNRSKEQSRKCVDDGLTSYEHIREELEKSSFMNNKGVIKACENSMNIKKNSLYSRMLSSEYGYSQFRLLKKRIAKNSFYPIVPWSGNRRNRWGCKAINFLFYSYLTYAIGSFLFTKIFTPYILPRYRRKVWANG